MNENQSINQSFNHSIAHYNIRSTTPELTKSHIIEMKWKNTARKTKFQSEIRNNRKRLILDQSFTWMDNTHLYSINSEIKIDFKN